MKYGRGFPLPQYGNGNGNRNQESWIPGMGIPVENGIGMLGQQFQQRGEIERLGETPRRPITVDDGMIRGRELEPESWITTMARTAQMRNGMVGNASRDSYTPIHQGNGIVRNGNGIVRNGENWNPLIPTDSYSQGGCSNSWTPATPGKPNPCNKPVNQMENENWGDLLGVYGNFLKQGALKLNEAAQDHYPMVQNNGNQNRVLSTTNRNLNSTRIPIPKPTHDLNQVVPSIPHFPSEDPSHWDGGLLAAQDHYPMVQNNGNQSRVLSTTNRNLNPNLNSTRIPIPKPTHDLNQVLPSIPHLPSEDPSHWDGGLLAAVVRPKNSSASVPFFNGSQNNSSHNLNQIPVLDSSTRLESNLVRPADGGSMLGNQSSNQLPTDGFPVPYRPCYNLNSPPRSELDAASSGITGQLPFSPITPDTRQKSAESQWVPVKNGQESRRNEDSENVYNDLSTSSAVSTTQREGLLSEEGDELGIDLNKTPNQKTPARRKKHRPKVIREGKVKKTATPKDVKNTSLHETPVKRKYVRKSPKENGVEISPEGVKSKRKYVRKKGVEVVDQSIGQQETEVEVTEPILETPVKSCKKQLNFDLECVMGTENQTRVDQSGFNLNDNPRDIEQERIINGVLKRSAMTVAQNNMYAGVTTHQESSRINGPTTPMAKARDHALNVLARNLMPGQGVWRNVSNQVGPVPTNGHSQTEYFDERRGIKRQSLEQINPRYLNTMNSLMYAKLLLGGDNHTERRYDLSTYIESQKRMKMQYDLPTRHPDGHPKGELTQYNGAYGNVSALQLRNSCNGKVKQSYQVNGRQFQPAIERSQRPSQGHEVISMTAMVSWNRPPTTPPKDYSRPAVGPYPATLIDKKRNAMQNSSSQGSNRADKTLLQIRKDTSQVHQISFTKPRGGPRKSKGVVSVEVLTNMLEELCLYEKNGNKDRNALVPYRGNNAIIPFEPIKKRKPRPKVDLDPESDRLWRLLMGPEGSAANETLDKDKEKWWEDERRVFRGRADSFIARMHLVQGDRRFSRWKGSVVDSVIGVYLTQNVSDHLSSSAFMSLAAKFPIKATNTNETRSHSACVLVEDPIETILPINKILRQPTFNQNSYVSFESSDHIRTAASSEVILSQNSLDSSTIQTIDEIRSSSGSNSEAEDQTNGFESSRDPVPPNPAQPERVNLFRELFSHDRSQYMQNLPKTPPGNMQNVGSTRFGSFPSNKSRIIEGCNSNLTSQQNEIPRFQVENSAHKQDSCSENCVVENTTAEANSKEQNGAHKNVSRGKKGDTEDEKKKAFDWDSLRRDVFLKCEQKERSKDAADSLDYEALRSARVNEISDAIRERGMNNLLADRIKDFLDRLVRDHGSIDLEWLRDVPPDKAKDYLLSIRGLGLKSVECVRLLTLHHLAFPVDTNVGRIAVRLGWVPLQPLPESLQLHLLEMYPVLESIQKYLWPRLCKLDQLTLYELHYQMITFGKVFCTKSKPNCNACPMRAECRHFASAFASARLALPGPEEKRMVPSDTPNVTHPMPPVISRPMSLPPAEINCNKDSRLLCEPIIEEPTTPEPETAELTLSDIEDHYYDDDDEIPTIKLDMNEFTMNLQKMQDSMEINADMSKALVALNPQAASIPTPKLKNISRLRTEHLVYELPDSHPILEGLYKREPDDPSHYLLAIWTPGETANSMQPPEKGCPTQESGMLCDSTTCFSCNCVKEANLQVVRGTILMPCRTAMRGSFPLNGTYFQVNEMFADHASSLKPIDVPRSWIWNLPRRTVYFGTSVSTIFKGLTTPEIQMCFWRGFVCVRGFDQKARSPRPLMARLHFPASKLVKNRNEEK